VPEWGVGGGGPTHKAMGVIFSVDRKHQVNPPERPNGVKASVTGRTRTELGGVDKDNKSDPIPGPRSNKTTVLKGPTPSKKKTAGEKKKQGT